VCHKAHAISHADVVCKKLIQIWWRTLHHHSFRRYCTRVLPNTYNIMQIRYAHKFYLVYAIGGVLFHRGFWRDVGREAKEIQMLASHTPITCVDIQKWAVSLERCDFVSSNYLGLSSCVCEMTHPCTWHDSWIHVDTPYWTRLIDTCGHDSSICVDMTHECMWTRLIHIRENDWSKCVT